MQPEKSQQISRPSCFLTYHLLDSAFCMTCHGKPILLIRYLGRSMNPTLWENDLLEVVPCQFTDICPGDVIYYLPAEQRDGVVHRVVQVTKDGLRTRGDRNMVEDILTVQPAYVIGKVVTFWRNTRHHHVVDGWRGRWRSAQLHIFWRMIGACSRILMPLIQRIQQGFFIRDIPKMLSLRQIVYQVDGQKRTYLYLGRSRIGWFDDDHCIWCLISPFGPWGGSGESEK